MKILFVTVEMAPLVKVGGLADVAGSLPRALIALGHDVRVIMPMHEDIDTARYGFRATVPEVTVGTPRGPEQAAVWEGQPGGIPVYLIQQSDMFERPQVYGEPDDHQRWLFFCDAVLAAAPRLGWQPDILHLNDWHAAFVAARLHTDAGHPLARTPVVYTIHNLALKGEFDEPFAVVNDLPAGDHAAAGVSAELLRSGMALGILHSDVLNTVSPTYAREILTPEFGAGLEPLLQRRQHDLYGVLNGIDYEEYNPATDTRLPATFHAGDLSGRKTVRAALLASAGMDPTEAPILGVVNRLFWQKGADIAVDAVQELLAEGADLRFILLGTGDVPYHEQLESLANRYPQRVALFLRFDPDLAQVIYGGSDLFLMPSRYEPCGLGQMIAMRYGAVPVVRRTGGLSDTVPDADATSEGRGFCFEAPEGTALAGALRRALAAYRQKERWLAIQQRGMRADLSWTEAAGHYVNLYLAAQDRAARRA